MPTKPKVFSAAKAPLKTKILQKSNVHNVFSERILSKPNRMIFDEMDFNLCAHNEFGRYALHNSKKIAHALISQDTVGNLIAEQYQIQSPANTHYVARVCQLKEIQKITTSPEANPIFIAKDNEGKTFIGKRVHHRIDTKKDLETPSSLEQTIPIDVVYFSEDEEESEEHDHFFSTTCSGHNPLRFFEETQPRSSQAQSTLRKGGALIRLNHQDIINREKNTTRSLSQNQIMGLKRQNPTEKDWSAVKECRSYADEHESHLSQAFFDFLQKSAKANLREHAASQIRGEWLHAYGFTLAPKDSDPQVAENLGAAPKWANTEMMILERIAKWFKLTLEKQAEVEIRSIFDLVQHSEIIRKIHYEVSIAHRHLKTRFVEDIYPLQENPLYHKASDLAQSVGIIHAQLNGEAPLSKITVTPIEKHVRRPVLEKIPSSLPSTPDQKEYQTLTIIDLETTGLDHTEDEITEIGLLCVTFDPNLGILELKHQYNGLSEPKRKELSAEIIRITGLTKDILKGQQIDWNNVLQILNDSDYVVCHNSNFDRKFLESATPSFISEKISKMRFGCSIEDINWNKRGFVSKKLVELNKKLGFSYTAHRALHDCWATLNLFIQLPSTLKELITAIESPTHQIIIHNVNSDEETFLKNNGFYCESIKNNENRRSCFKRFYSDESLQECIKEIESWPCVLRRETPYQKGYMLRSMTSLDLYSVRAALSSPSSSLESTGFFRANEPLSSERAAATPSQKLG